MQCIAAGLSRGEPGNRISSFFQKSFETKIEWFLKVRKLFLPICSLKGGERMKKIALAIVLSLALAVPAVFAQEATVGLSELGWGNEEKSVVVHLYDPLYGGDADVFRTAFWEVKELLPDGDSRFAVVRYPEVNRFHVRLSDGVEHVVYAVGVGSTFEAAVRDLVRELTSR